jgi:hypothetical protein
MLHAKHLRALGNNTQASTRSIGMTAIFAFCARKFRGILFYKTNIPVMHSLAVRADVSKITAFRRTS